MSEDEYKEDYAESCGAKDLSAFSACKPHLDAVALLAEVSSLHCFEKQEKERLILWMSGLIEAKPSGF
jgi:hypothetical protein